MCSGKSLNDMPVHICWENNNTFILLVALNWAQNTITVLLNKADVESFIFYFICNLKVEAKCWADWALDRKTGHNTSFWKHLLAYNKSYLHQDVFKNINK